MSAAKVKASFTSVAAIIKDRLSATGQFLNVGGPADFADAINAQRTQIAATAKTLGVSAAR